MATTVPTIAPKKINVTVGSILHAHLAGKRFGQLDFEAGKLAVFLEVKWGISAFNRNAKRAALLDCIEQLGVRDRTHQ